MDCDEAVKPVVSELERCVESIHATVLPFYQHLTEDRIISELGVAEQARLAILSARLLVTSLVTSQRCLNHPPDSQLNRLDERVRDYERKAGVVQTARKRIRVEGERDNGAECAAPNTNRGAALNQAAAQRLVDEAVRSKRKE